MKNNNKILKGMPIYLYIITFFVYLASITIVLIFYNSILSNQDTERYRFCDIEFKIAVGNESFSKFEQYIEQNLTGVLNVSLLCKNNMGTYNLAEKEILNDKDDLVVYGAHPYIIEHGSDVNLEPNNLYNIVVVEFENNVSKKDIRLIKKYVKKLDKGADITYKNTGKWLWQNIEFYKYMVVMILGIVLFAVSSIILILRSWIEKEKKRIAVYILCGADNEFLRKHYIQNYFFVIAFSYIFALIIILTGSKFVIHIDNISECILPAFLGFIVACLNYLLFSFELKKQLSKNFMSLWRKCL